MSTKPISVSQLNTYLNRIISSDPILMNVCVSGEISNLTKHSSGHWYFSLKDKSSTVRCFLSSSRVSHLRFDLDEGMEILVFGYVSVFEKGGYYSLNIRDVDIQGEGALQKAFEKLKAKLYDEGLFDEEHKKSLPEFPKKVGVITSPTGAAIKDIITTIKRRNPLVDVFLYPALVQGEGSGDSLVAAIETMNSSFKDCDVLIIGRGGGSMEDLWSFNEEAVARAVYHSKIPVISAVGHEVDFVITDYVADVRAATPTAAAELAVPHINNYIDRINACKPEKVYSDLKNRIDIGIRNFKYAFESCSTSIQYLFSDYENKLKLLKTDIESSNPLSVLNKGYAAVKSADGIWLTDISDVNPGDRLDVMFKDGSLHCMVETKEFKNA